MNEKKFISLNEIENCQTFKNYKEFTELGKGANAVTFKAKHKIINQVVVIKVYAKFIRNTESMDKKHLAEIKKNSEFRLTKDQSVVFDAGTIFIKNENYQYSIMNYLDGITLEQWLKKKSCYKINQKEIEINAALGFLYCCYNLIENDKYKEIIHGDINQGNVIFLKQKKYVAGTDEFLSYCTSLNDYLVPTTVELIDYGTSKWEKTKPEKGINRDLKFIMDNTCKILSSYPIDDFIDYNAIVNEEDDSRRCYRRNYLIVDLIRIVLSIHFLNELHLKGYEKKCQSWLRKLWYHEFEWDDKFEFNQFINLRYWFALKKPSMGGYINEKLIVDYMNKNNKEFYEITFIEKFTNPKIVFK